MNSAANISPLSQVEIHDQMALALFLHAGNEFDSDSEEVPTAPSIDLADELLRQPQDSFGCYARDDSLFQQGVSEGDLLLADRKLKPQHNDIVIVSFDGELLCRQLDMNSCLRCDEEESLLDEHAGLLIEAWSSTVLSGCVRSSEDGKTDQLY